MPLAARALTGSHSRMTLNSTAAARWNTFLRPKTQAVISKTAPALKIRIPLKKITQSVKKTGGKRKYLNASILYTTITYIYNYSVCSIWGLFGSDTFTVNFLFRASRADPCPILRIWGKKDSGFEGHFCGFLRTRNGVSFWGPGATHHKHLEGSIGNMHVLLLWTNIHRNVAESVIESAFKGWS